MTPPSQGIGLTLVFNPASGSFTQAWRPEARGGGEDDIIFFSVRDFHKFHQKYTTTFDAFTVL